MGDNKWQMDFMDPCLLWECRGRDELLRGMLNGHSQLFIPLNETEFLPSWIRKWASFGDLSNRHTFMAFYQRFVDTFYFFRTECRSMENRYDQMFGTIDVLVTFLLPMCSSS